MQEKRSDRKPFKQENIRRTPAKARIRLPGTGSKFVQILALIDQLGEMSERKKILSLFFQGNERICQA